MVPTRGRKHLAIFRDILSGCDWRVRACVRACKVFLEGRGQVVADHPMVHKQTPCLVPLRNPLAETSSPLKTWLLG